MCSRRVNCGGKHRNTETLKHRLPTLILWLAPLAWLWFVLINDLRVEWTVNSQYAYGWAVPFLCGFLIWQRIQKTESRKQKVETHFSFQFSKFQLFALALCALLYAPTRLIEEANPGWRLVSWALALEVTGLTLLFIRLALGASPLRSGRGENSPKHSRIDPLNCSSRRKKVLTLLYEFQMEPPHVGCYKVPGEGQGEVSSRLSAFQRFSVSDFLFPVCFFLVAVPWPSLVEQPLIQGLTRLDTSITTELLGWFGIAAMPHGNVIELATGVVGIDEACSGIRSFQATLMISLFLGELYQLSVLGRSALCFAGFALSFLFNLARMSLVVWVAARKGQAAFASWHDPAGVTILVACFCCLWGMGVFLKSRKLKTEMLKGESGGRRTDDGLQTAESGKPSGKAEMLKPAGGGRKSDDGLRAADGKAECQKQKTEGKNEFQISDLARAKNFSISAFQLSAFPIALTVWILLTEFSIEAWYRWHEARVPWAAQWTVAWPTNNPTFKELPLAATTRQILRYDEGRRAGWADGNLSWQAAYLRWNPGRTAVHLAQNHTPNICMTAAGYELDSIAPQEWFEVDGLRMPFSVNQVTDTPWPVYVFYCLWDDRASAQGFATMGLTYGNRLAPVLAGLRNPGQRSLEIALDGPDNAAAAETAVRAELQKLVAVKPGDFQK